MGGGGRPVEMGHGAASNVALSPNSPYIALAGRGAGW